MFVRSSRCLRVLVTSDDRMLSMCVVSRTTVRPLANMMMVWSLVADDIRKLYGNHLTVSQIRVDKVECVHIL